MSHCRRGHAISGPQDRTHGGDCLMCRRTRQAAYMRECRHARTELKMLKAILAAG